VEEGEKPLLVAPLLVGDEHEFGKTAKRPATGQAPPEKAGEATGLLGIERGGAGLAERVENVVDPGVPEIRAHAHTGEDEGSGGFAADALGESFGQTPLEVAGDPKRSPSAPASSVVAAAHQRLRATSTRS